MPSESTGPDIGLPAERVCPGEVDSQRLRGDGPERRDSLCQSAAEFVGARGCRTDDEPAISLRDWIITMSPDPHLPFDSVGQHLPCQGSLRPTDDDPALVNEDGRHNRAETYARSHAVPSAKLRKLGLPTNATTPPIPE